MRDRLRPFVLIMIALLIPIVPFVVIGELPGERWLSATDDDALIFGLTGAGLLASDILLPVPSTIVGTLLGARLGFTVGWIAAWAGLVLGNMVGYGIGRAVPRRIAPELPQAPTLAALIVSRPVPIVAEAMTFAAGAGGMHWIPFTAASAGANAVFAAALALNGAALLPDALAGPGLALPLLLPVIAWLGWKRRLRRAGTDGR